MAERQAPSETSFEAVAPFYDELMQGVPYRFWVTYLKRLWKHFSLEPESVLDLACGTGTIAILLAEEGYRVAGVDLSEPMLVEARKKAASAGLTIDFMHQDAARLDLGERRFDCVVSFFDSLNNILDPADLQAAFSGVYRHVAAGGLFIFDINTEYAFIEGMFNQRSTPLDGPLQYDWRARYDPAARLCTITMDFAFTHSPGEPPQRFREVHLQRAYDRSDVLAMLENAGFSNTRVFDAYTLSPPKRRSDRVFYITRRLA
jgi:ubiquinone/menaquinone biosynthesis C-methylase UbiE